MYIHGYVIKSTKGSHDPAIFTCIIPKTLKNDSLLLKYDINCSKFIPILFV